jgi:hypothetical protein
MNDIDRTLREQLQELAPRDDDTESALTSLAPRAHRARTRRRAAAVLAGSGVVALSFVGLAALAGGSNPNVEIVPPATQPSVTTPTTDGARGSTSTSSTTSETSGASTPTSGSRPDDTGSEVSTPVGSTPGTTPGTGTTPTSDTTAAEPSEHTYTGTGGSVTVRFDGATLTLVATRPSAGFTSQVAHEEPDRIEVRFESETHETRIEVRVEDGALEPRIEENGG